MLEKNDSAASLAECIRFVLRGNEGAVSCFLLLRDVLHFWDDLVDRDKDVTAQDVSAAMFKALVTLPTNEFYRAHQPTLMPVLINAIGNWHAANVFEADGSRNRLELSFVIRSDYANLLVHFAYLVGGADWMVQVTPMIRLMWTPENFDDYRKNLDVEKAERAKRSM